MYRPLRLIRPLVRGVGTAVLALTLIATGCASNSTGPEGSTLVTATGFDGTVLVLLPIQHGNPKVKEVAGWVQNGVAAGARLEQNQNNVKVKVLDSARPPDLGGYLVKQIEENKAKVVIGPLLDTEVAAVEKVAGAVKVPILVFSKSARHPPEQFVLSSLDEVSDARDKLIQRSYKRIAVLYQNDGWGKRLKGAVECPGGKISVCKPFDRNDTSAKLKALVGNADIDAVLLIANAEHAQVFPRIKVAWPEVPVVATSDVAGAPPRGLKGLMFVDMPLLLDPGMRDQLRAAGVTVGQGDQARFFALGLDAYYLAARLAQGQAAQRAPAATARSLSMDRGGRVVRKGLDLAEFGDPGPVRIDAVPGVGETQATPPKAPVQDSSGAVSGAAKAVPTPVDTQPSRAGSAKPTAARGTSAAGTGRSKSPSADFVSLPQRRPEPPSVPANDAPASPARPGTPPQSPPN